MAAPPPAGNPSPPLVRFWQELDRIPRSDHDDVLQDLRLRMLRAERRFDARRGTPEVFVAVILTRVIADRRRSRGRRQHWYPIDSSFAIESVVDHRHDIEAVDLALDVSRVIATLPEPLRDIPLHSVSGGKCSCLKPDCGSAGKHPRTEHGCKDGTNDPETIRRWWVRWPDANIGVCTGAESGIVMLGTDGHAGAMDLTNLEEQFGYLPETPTARSGSGGRHLLFRHPGIPLNNRKNHLGTSIDARGDGGYFVAAPSANANGTYEWIDGPDDVPVAAMPQWLIEWWTRDKIAPPPPSDDPLPYRHTSGTDNYARAMAYVAGMPEAIGSREHPTMKPVALWSQAIADGSRPGELVYDPFLGSGTTLIAAEQLGRTCHGMEISPQYADVIVQRFETLAGTQAERIPAGI
jgi:Bifunctional DNA primase/polymerase, N-terminal/DNA methylase/Sigma-70 region 2